MRRSARTAMVVLIALVLPLGVAAQAQPGTDPGVLPGGEWALIAIDGASVPADAGAGATFGPGGLVNGIVGCAGFSGPYSVDGGAIDIGPLVDQPGPPACTSAGMALEPRMLEALETAETWSIEDDRLKLASAAGAGSLTFGRSGAAGGGPDTTTANQSKLSDVEWLLIAKGPTKPQKLAVRFEPNGLLSATTACFNVSGSYDIDGKKLSVSASKDLLGQQRCDFGVLGAADNFLNVLNSAKSWKVDKKGRLTIKPDATYKGVTLIFKPGDAIAPPGDAIAPPADIDLEGLAGPWRIRATIDASGETALPDEFDITLMLGADGTLQVNAGCNDYEGTYTLADGDAITIGELSAAASSCDATLQDQDFMVFMLPLVDGLAIEDGNLVLDIGQFGKFVFEPAP
ncbi:MAG: META domain-containing protein [Chloroflexota bacterium]